MQSRRNAITGAAAALGAFGTAAGASAHHAAAAGIESSEYWAEKGPVRLYLYRKRVAAPHGEQPVLFLVHGSSMSSRSTFDLSVPGDQGEYSLMNVFARRGWDVWTMDHEGYGRSSRTEGNSDIASGAADLLAAAAVAERETGARRFHLLGTSSGALRAARFAQENPDRAARLVLAAFTWTGRDSPTLERRARNLDYFRAHNRRPRGRDMLRSIFTRDKPGTADMAVAEALADAELQFGEDIPTGTYLDMTANLPVVDPVRIASPVLLVRGEHDGIASMADLWDFFDRLPNGDRQFVVLADAAHSLTFGHNRAQFWHAAQAFLSMPAPVAA
jgi:alpha-beta hydrolase superfamily lysophospholipase